jgi:uncharacterized repeat protein (TIGR01451 family)
LDTIALYASTDGTVDSSSELIGSIKKVLKLNAGKTASLPVPIKSLSLPAGTYTILASTTGAGGTISDSATGPTVTVSSPFVSLAGSITGASPTMVRPGKPLTLTLSLSNSGNTVATGPATIAAGLSSDGMTVAAPLQTLTESLKIKPGGKPQLLRLHIKVPASTSAGSFFPIVSLTQGSTTLTFADSSQITIS